MLKHRCWKMMEGIALGPSPLIRLHIGKWDFCRVESCKNMYICTLAFNRHLNNGCLETTISKDDPTFTLMSVHRTSISKREPTLAPWPTLACQDLVSDHWATVVHYGPMFHKMDTMVIYNICKTNTFLVVIFWLLHPGYSCTKVRSYKLLIDRSLDR